MKKMKLYCLKNRNNFTMNIYQIGYEKCQSDHSFGPISRDFYVLHFILNGKGYLSVDNQTFNIMKGDIFLVPEHLETKYCADPNDPYEYYWIGFSGLEAKNLLEIIGLKENNWVIKTGEHFEKILNAFSKIDEFKSEGSLKDNLRSISILLSIFSTLTDESIEYGGINDEKEYFNKILSTIETNYSSITMRQLEESCSLHRSNIYRTFKKNLGISPKEYILNYRLQKALFFLKNTDFSIKKIAISVGFNDTAYFCKAFKDKFKKTPSETRKLL